MTSLPLFIAHQRKKDGEKQTLQQHLQGVADLSKTAAAKLELEQAGELMGLLHDLGKYSKEFQDYINSALGNIDPDEDDYVDAKGQKGKIDHSTAGAQAIWAELAQQGQSQSITAQILALCIASHHSGLIDCLESNSTTPVWDRFSNRMKKAENRAHLEEVLAKMDEAIRQRFRQLIESPTLHESVFNKLIEIGKKNKGSALTAGFKQGLLVRLLFSCLIDADRVDTADFENPVAAQKRLKGRYAHFDTLIDRLETKLLSFTADTDVNKIRQQISDHCLQHARHKPGIFTLSVPTGGGKTLASLRFALNHAKTHGLERVIYVIPFTSIIDQNAEETRKILEPEGSGDEGNIVLEHHSNLTPEEQTWKTKILSENWDAPVVYTTMVQFLETLFGSGTRGARRMHQLSKSVLIFDEIQTLPINCVHLFNNAIHFLVDHCGSSVVLCTATQPLLNEVDPKKGRIELAPDSEMMPEVKELFADLRRVEVIDKRKDVGWWSFDEVAEQAIKDVDDMGSCLVIVNTKNAAQEIFIRCKQSTGVPVFHLSTSMCPAHRKAILSQVRQLLDADEDVLCISTQLIEAGVDVDFGAVIRFTAGLDSIAQAAGRCNRNGKRRNPDGSLKKGRVSIVNPADENLDRLPSIKKGKQITERLLREFKDNSERFDQGDLIGPTAMQWYFRYYFFERQDEMTYPVAVGWDDNLLGLLSSNEKLVQDYERINKTKPAIYFKQSFMTAAKAFKAIDAPTRGILVPYGKRGNEIITALCAAYEPDKQFALLREAQQYTVNVFPNLLTALDKAEVIHAVQEGIDILYLMKPEYYNEHFGLADIPTQKGTNFYDF